MYREFRFTTTVVDDDVELLSILVQVLRSYPNADHQLAVDWLKQRIGHQL